MLSLVDDIRVMDFKHARTAHRIISNLSRLVAGTNFDESVYLRSILSVWQVTTRCGRGVPT